MNKIAIILDTQIAHSPDKNCSFDEFHIFEYDNTVDFIERHELTEKIEIFIPEIVVNEIAEQRIRNLKKDLSKLNNLRGRFLSSGICDISDENKDFNSIKHIDTLKERKLKHLNVIPIPEDRLILFNDILEKSLKKYPPFKQGKSDQGFKDAIILSSIIDFFKNKKEYEVYLFSDDNGFSSVNIEEIFNKEEIKLEIKNGVGIQNFLISKFKLKIELKEYIEEGFFKEDIEQIVNIEVTKKEEIIIKLVDEGYNISEVIIEKYYINEVSDNEYEVVFSIIINMQKDGNEILENKFNLSLIFKNVDGLWDIKIPRNNE